MWKGHRSTDKRYSGDKLEKYGSPAEKEVSTHRGKAQRQTWRKKA